jgi:hypothetical protein
MGNAASRLVDPDGREIEDGGAAWVESTKTRHKEYLVDARER